MANWTDITQAVADLRRFVNDSPTDRPVKRKQVIGRVDGINVNYMTWDDRIIDTSLIVSLDDFQYDPSQISVDDPILGRFHLIPTTLPNLPAVPPPAQSTVRAAYFFQYFIDEDLVMAMEMAAQEISETDDVTAIASGLKLAAMNFGAYVGFEKQAMRWEARKSTEFILQEEPLDVDTMNRASHLQKMAEKYYEMAIKLRNGFYQRHGRRDAPAFNIFKPNTIPRGGFPRR
jgi:hypothetical protein